MPVTRTTVIGNFAKSNGTPYTSGKVFFTLNKFGLDTTLSEIVMNEQSTANLDTDGNFTIDLWPNAAGLASTSYSVKLQTGEEKLVRDIGSVSIPDVETTVDLYSLISAVTPPSTGSIIIAADQAEYDATTPDGDEWVVLYG